MPSDSHVETAALYAEELRKWRELRGLSKRALAQQMAYDRSYISHIEGGNLSPTEDFTRRAEEVLATDGALWSAWKAFLSCKAHQERRLSSSPANRDLRCAPFLSWAAEHSALTFQQAYNDVVALVAELEAEPASTRYARDHALSHISRQVIAEALITYYHVDHSDQRVSFYQATLNNGSDPLSLSLLVRPDWVDAVAPLATEHEVFRLVSFPDPPTTRLAGPAIQAALRRIASVEFSQTVLTDNPLYQLLDVDIKPGSVQANLALTNFLAYAFTADLLESELLQALATTSQPSADPRGRLETPLRDIYLPTTEAALHLRDRNCVGGPVALLAIARGRNQDAARDYVLLVQERSSRVLNVTGKLAVIPKAFHQPTVEAARELRLSSTLQREFEEELLGRQDLECLSEVDHRHADPLHRARCSEPMRWLLDHQGTDAYRTECVGFGINMVSGNYEFPCLIVIEDEEWWERYGHQVEANWETMRVRRYSSLDTEGLTTLAADPAWSNEGLFAFLQGLRRLSSTDTHGRVAAPVIQVEV